LAPIEAALQTLANNPGQRLTLGKLDVRTDARIVTTPIALDYGFTRRLSLGVVVPIVQTRWSAQVRVNEHTATDSLRRGNTGLIPPTLRLSAATTNAAVVTALTSASASLTALLGRCQTNPTAAECNPVRGQEAAAAAAARRASEFAAGVRTAYGVTEQTTIVAPLAGSALAAQIEAQRVSLAAQLATYSPGVTVGTPVNANTEFSYADFQGRNTVPGLLQTPLGGGIDSIRTTERTGLGDVELRASYTLLDRMQTDTMAMRGTGYRLDLGGAYRLNTSMADSARNLTDIGTGDGPGVELRSALEIVSGHVGGTIAARYWTAFGRTVDAALVGFPEGGFPYPSFGTVTRKSGNVLGIDVRPRVFLGEWLAFEGEYGLEHAGVPTFTSPSGEECSACAPLLGSILPAARTVQRLGVGLRYSTIESYLRRRARYPVEVSFRHLQAISGDPGAPQGFRDQILLRLFYQVRR
jgi:hypothetical protein